MDERHVLRNLSWCAASALTMLAASAAATEPLATEGSDLTPRVEPASEIQSDGVYGRFDGDLDLGLALGTEITELQVSPAAMLSAHYYATAGLYVGYTDAFDEGSGNQRVLSTGVELRPLFLPRFAFDAEGSSAFWDLLMDSVGIGLGAYWDQPAGADFGQRRGLEAFLGFGVPLFSNASGLWLRARALGRFTDGGLPGDYGAFTVQIAWHELIQTGLTKQQ